MPTSTHPYFMYDHIRMQPEAVADVARRLAEPVRDWRERTQSRTRGFLVGTGSSLHGAQIGEYLFLLQGDPRTIRAVTAIDYVNYHGALGGESDFVTVISHRGTKRFSRQALEIAASKGCATALITGRNSPSVDLAEVAFSTVEQERSSAHTVSLMTALTTLALAAGVSQQFLEHEFPRLLTATIAMESSIAEAAARHSRCQRIWIVGNGPGGVIAQEAALKIKETSYVQAEGMATETMLHGPFQGTGPEDLFVLVAPSGKARFRTLELLPMVADIGASVMVVGSSPPETQHFGNDWIGVPEAPEPFGALTCLVVLQLFAYHLALARGTNPDGFRLEDPRFASACKRVTL